jgi:hypothetical protein
MKIILNLILVIFLFSGVIQAEDVFKFPYGLAFHEKQDVYFVSYIAEDPTRKNRNGYISKFDKDLTKVLDKYFIKGLNAPRGLVVYEDEIYIADLNEIKVYDLNEKIEIETFVVGRAGESLITDICTDNERYIYACDMLGNKIIMIDMLEDYKVTILQKGSWLEFPSSLVYDKINDRLIVSAYETGRIYEIDLEDLFVRTITPFTIENVNSILLDKDNLYISGGKQEFRILKFYNNKLTEIQKLDSSSGDMYLSKDNLLFCAVQYRDNIKKINLKGENKQGEV